MGADEEVTLRLSEAVCFKEPDVPVKVTVLLEEAALDAAVSVIF